MTTTPPAALDGAEFRRPALSVFGRLFQARMWREYARAFDGYPTASGINRIWLENVAHVTRAECMRRARINGYLARRLNRKDRT